MAEKMYILETDVLIGALQQDSNDHVEGVIFSYGFKDVSTTTIPFGGISKQVVKTGGVPTEATVFQLKVNTGLAADDNEGLLLTLVDSIDRSVVPNVAGPAVVPFEVIHLYMQWGTNGAPSGFADLEYFTLVNDGTDYMLDAAGKDTYDNEILNWFRDNLNNIPHITLKCYPTAP